MRRIRHEPDTRDEGAPCEPARSVARLQQTLRGFLADAVERQQLRDSAVDQAVYLFWGLWTGVARRNQPPAPAVAGWRELLHGHAVLVAGLGGLRMYDALAPSGGKLGG